MEKELAMFGCTRVSALACVSVVVVVQLLHSESMSSGALWLAAGDASRASKSCRGGNATLRGGGALGGDSGAVLVESADARAAGLTSTSAVVSHMGTATRLRTNGVCEV